MREESLEVAGEPRLLRVSAASRGARSVGRAGARRCPQVCGADPKASRFALSLQALQRAFAQRNSRCAQGRAPARIMTNCLISSSAFNPSFPFLPLHPSRTQSLLSPRQPAVRARLAVPGHFVSLDLRLFPFPVLP